MRPPRRLRRRWFPVCGRESPGSGEAAFALGEAVFEAYIARGQDRLARPSDPRASAGDLLTAKPDVDGAHGEPRSHVLPVGKESVRKCSYRVTEDETKTKQR